MIQPSTSKRQWPFFDTDDKYAAYFDGFRLDQVRRLLYRDWSLVMETDGTVLYYHREHDVFLASTKHSDGSDVRVKDTAIFENVTAKDLMPFLLKAQMNHYNILAANSDEVIAYTAPHDHEHQNSSH